MMAPMILIVFLLDSSGYREAMNIRTNCFEVKTEEEWTLKNWFSVKLSNLRNILSWPFQNSFGHQKVLIAFLCLLFSFILLSCCVECYKVKYSSKITFFLKMGLRRTSRVNFVLEKCLFWGDFWPSGIKYYHLLSSEGNKTYNILKIQSKSNPMQLKTDIYRKIGSYNNFASKMSAFCNQDLEM